MILHEIFSYFAPKALVLALLYFLVLVLVFIDLRGGIKKAKRNKQYVSSRGLRRTMSKIATYLVVLLAVTIVDTMLMLGIYGVRQYGSLLTTPVFPILTFIVAIFTGIIEVKSIYENTDKEYAEKIKNIAKEIGKFVKWAKG